MVEFRTQLNDTKTTRCICETILYPCLAAMRLAIFDESKWKQFRLRKYPEIFIADVKDSSGNDQFLITNASRNSIQMLENVFKSLKTQIH